MSTEALGKGIQIQSARGGKLVSPHLEVSLARLERAAPERGVSIIDVGGGESTLVDDLFERGYRNITVLDISPTALDVTKRRLGSAAAQIRWLAGDVTQR